MNYLSLPGTTSNYASAPHTAAMDITGDIDMRVFCAADTWKAGSGQVLFSMWAGGTNSAYQLFISNAGVFSLFWEDTVPSTKNANCTQNLTTIFNTGVPIWLRATLKVDNGAAGRDIKFYSSNDGQTWAQLGSTVTQAGTTAINLCTDVLTIGIQHATTQPFLGKVFYAELRNGINGTIVANPDFRGYVSSGFTDSTGNVWTVNSTGVTPAQIASRLPANYLSLPGVVSNYVSVPDGVGISVTGDIDLRARVALNKWLPALNNFVFSKNPGGLRSYDFYIQTTGKLNMDYSVDGTTNLSALSSVAPAMANEEALWIRVTRVASTGIITFYIASGGLANPVAANFVQLGNTVSGTVGNLADSSAQLDVGAHAGGTSSPVGGRYYRAQIRNGIDGSLVLDIDFTGAVSSGSTDPYNNTWTVNSSGASPAALAHRTLAAA